MKLVHHEQGNRPELLLDTELSQNETYAVFGTCQWTLLDAPAGLILLFVLLPLLTPLFLPLVLPLLPPPLPPPLLPPLLPLFSSLIPPFIPPPGLNGGGGGGGPYTQPG